MEKLKFIVVGLCFLFWPLSLFLANTFGDFLKYLIPALLVGLSTLLFKSKSRIYLLPLLFIPVVEPKFAIFPLCVTLAVFFLEKQGRFLIFIFILISLLATGFVWKGFWGQTVFQPDYQAQQEIIGKSYLYPSVFLARFFQNKPRIYINKFNNNLFAIVDPNNYFFNFHPREIKIDNQNLNKYPFLSIVFALIGFYYLNKYPNWRFILVTLVSAVISLSVLKLFDRNDFILWPSFSIIIMYGANIFMLKQKRLAKLFFIVFLIFTSVELVRIFINT